MALKKAVVSDKEQFQGINSTDVVWHQAKVTRARREAQNGHKSCVL